MGKRIIIDIAKRGKVQVEADGYNGVGCREATCELLKSLGTEQSTEFKASYTPDVEQHNAEQQGQ